jgi:hypothetical protein
MAGCFGGLGNILGGGAGASANNSGLFAGGMLPGITNEAGNFDMNKFASLFVDDTDEASSDVNPTPMGLTTKENYQGIPKLLGGSGGLKRGEQVQGLLNILKLLGIGKGI